METLTYTGELTIVTCWCGCRHAVPKEMYEHMKRQHDNGVAQEGIHCPHGHSWTFAGKGAAQRLREENERKDAQLHRELAAHDQTRAELATKERQRRAEKGAKTRVKNRIGNGVCPCCDRHFSNLHEHIQKQHPDFIATANKDEATA